jgi:hypothetical protein
MLRTRNLLLALVACAAFGAVSSANTNYYYSGHACSNRNVADTAWWHDSEGFRYNSTGLDQFQYAWCPANGRNNQAVDLDGATVYYNDGQSEYSISCQLFVTNNTGGVYSSTARYSCGSDTVNGCTSGAYGSAEAAKTGYGSISWSGDVPPSSTPRVMSEFAIARTPLA